MCQGVCLHKLCLYVPVCTALCAHTNAKARMCAQLHACFLVCQDLSVHIPLRTVYRYATVHSTVHIDIPAHVSHALLCAHVLNVPAQL